MQPQHQPTNSIYNIQSIPLQYQQPMTNNFISSHEQFIHLQLHPQSMATTPAP
ncbi:unnamed protein product, partial [Rotaria magnacalcarata]